MDLVQLSNFLAASVRMATPLLIAGLGLTISEKAGLINIGVEGTMLVAAFSAYAGSKLSGSYWIGLMTGISGAMLISLLFAVTTITFKAKQIIIGAALNILCAGLSSFLFRFFFVGTGHLEKMGIAARTFPIIRIPGLSAIPVLGPMLFSHNLLVYFGLLMTAVIWVVLNRTSLGLKIIAVGDHSLAADTLGINVVRLRYAAVLFSGAMIGVAGSFLSIAQASSFGEDMTAGRGFIAMAVVILGKWNPVGVLAGALLFGSASALQMIIQLYGGDFPRNIIMMVPYLATVIAVIAVSRRKVGAPLELGIPYEKS